jgi:hypothetical protein
MALGSWTVARPDRVWTANPTRNIGAAISLGGEPFRSAIGRKLKLELV